MKCSQKTIFEHFTGLKFWKSKSPTELSLFGFQVFFMHACSTAHWRKSKIHANEEYFSEFQRLYWNWENNDVLRAFVVVQESGWLFQSHFEVLLSVANIWGLKTVIYCLLFTSVNIYQPIQTFPEYIKRGHENIPEDIILISDLIVFLASFLLHSGPQ